MHEAQAQRFTKLDAALIRGAHQKRIDVIVLRRDRPWIVEMTPFPAAQLSRMASRGALIALGGGRYAIAPVGSQSLAASTTWQALVHAELDPLGPYYIGFMSALEEHRLTDQDSARITAAIGFHNDRLQRQHVKTAGRPLTVTTMRQPLFEFGIERVRQSSTQMYMRSDLERTLVDCLQRPRMVGPAEVWVMAWSRAFQDERVDKDRLLNYALQVGTSAARRTGLMFSLLGHGEQARDKFPSQVRRADRVVAFLADGPPATPTNQVDP